MWDKYPGGHVFQSDDMKNIKQFNLAFLITSYHFLQAVRSKTDTVLSGVLYIFCKMHHKTPFRPKIKCQFLLDNLITISHGVAKQCVSAHSVISTKTDDLEFTKPFFNFPIKIQGRNIHCFATRLKRR